MIGGAETTADRKTDDENSGWEEVTFQEVPFHGFLNHSVSEDGRSQRKGPEAGSAVEPLSLGA